MQSRACKRIFSALALAAVAFSQSPAWAGVSAACPQSSFTKANFDRIEEGMTIESINSLLGCAASPHLTYRKDYATSYYWATVGGSLKYIQIWFDEDGRKVQRLHPAFEFKTSTGF